MGSCSFDTLHAQNDGFCQYSKHTDTRMGIRISMPRDFLYEIPGSALVISF